MCYVLRIKKEWVSPRQTVQFLVLSVPPRFDVKEIWQFIYRSEAIHEHGYIYLVSYEVRVTGRGRSTVLPIFQSENSHSSAIKKCDETAVSGNKDRNAPDSANSFTFSVTSQLPSGWLRQPSTT